MFFCLYFQGFAQIFRDFVKVSRDFAQISMDFAQIFTKSKLLVVRLHLQHPHLLHLLWPEKIPRAAHNMYRLARLLLILPN